ncbi:ADP-ribose glycohydrolase OARD1-like [Panulirus ornatus]|uniref:ADP-ribose glycohydrolase OARD1-like n=1 Tax=Panulirus ornatus TaxID=150431 RepID=UPI003A89BF6E
MDKYLITPKRKMTEEITENFDANGDIKKSKGNHVRSEGFAITEVRGDLFTCPDGTSLAHCISQDIRMGKGIAYVFKAKFGGVQELTDQGKKPGDVAVLKRGQKYVYALVTKERYWHKPTYLSVRSSLQAMKRHSLQHNVGAIAMPRIGCGRDGLVWDRVREILTDVFKDTDIKISVYSI